MITHRLHFPTSGVSEELEAVSKRHAESSSALMRKEVDLTRHLWMSERITEGIRTVHTVHAILLTL